VKLLSLKAHNVFSIGTVELDLKDRGLTLVTGWSYDDNNGNMAGKSSVANHCISWGLYGRTVHGIKADDVINTSIPHAKHCGVTLHFEGIDGCEYRIYRARKPKSLVLSIKNVDEDEWGDLSKRNEKDTQELIDKLLGRDHRTFIQSDFFGQGRERSFLALAGSDQRAVIEEILPLTSLEGWSENAKEEYSKAKDKVRDANVAFDHQRERSNMAWNHQRALETQLVDWDADNLITQAGVRNKLNKIQLMSSGIEQEVQTLAQALPSAYTVEENLSRYSKEAHDIMVQLNTLGYKIDTLTGNIDRRAAKPEVCVSCNQQLPPEKIRENRVERVADLAMRDILVKQRGEAEAKLYNANAQSCICNEALELQAKVGTKEEEAGLTEKLATLLGTPNPFRHLVNSAREEYTKEDTIKQNYARIIELEQEHRDHCYFWKNAFGSDIKTLLFEQVCPFLETKTNEYLRDLNNGQIKVKFSTTRELKSGDTKDQFCVTASSDTGSNIFELFSGAEKQLTSFAVGMALSDLAGMQVAGASSFMILDEPFLYQSPENCENIISFITNRLVGDGSTILLISNEDNLVNLVPNRVHVTKEKGVTSIA
jgi:DNA repair exonuclease SbcCD ATPase subunit